MSFPRRSKPYPNSPTASDSSTSLLSSQFHPSSSPRRLQAPPRRPPSASALSQSSLASSLSEKYSLSADPSTWGANISPHNSEPDDFLHNPDPRRDRKIDHGGTLCTGRGFQNIGCLLLLAVGITGLFAGYPITSFFLRTGFKTFGAFNVGGLNASGQVPSMDGNWGLIDLDTPKDAYKRTSHTSKKKMQLVFSDEFNVEGRSFYPGDDPYWEALDLHYWATGNLEWYDPGGATTKNGALEITLTKQDVHDLHYQGGMITTWNKFCFTGGLVETSLTLPGANNIHGLWPAVWMMGNLGRAGYGATLDGLWPYSYDACDVGTAPNQTRNGLPPAALTTGGDRDKNFVLSYLPGQRLSRCTCPGEDHPGPIHKEDGRYVGRAAPEIDIFEAQIDELGGSVSQSVQWAPFNAKYEWDNVTNAVLSDPVKSKINSYKGGVFQQAASVVTVTNQDCYEIGGTGCYATYGVEYKPGYDDAYISWINDGEVAWTLLAPGVGPDTAVEIAARPIPVEPMYLLANLGMSESFGKVELDRLTFPTTMRIDYVRVYQPEDDINIGCDPPAYPTAAYINKFMQAYTDANLTTWVDGYHQKIPRNSFMEPC